MDNWTSGYVADIGYTFGYYSELNPARIKLAMLYAGVEPPDIKNACELGFGQGISANLHSASNSSIAWYGTDFNPSQAGFAQGLAKASGANVHLFDQAFADFCSRDDLPDFDYIGLHGIWSWISDENRQIIVDFIARKLAVGGVLYISYNTLPGWSTAAPLRHLLTQYSETMSGSGHGIINRIEASLSFTEELIASEPIYTIANPNIPERFNQIKVQNKNYLAHEYFNRDWLPMYYADMDRWLSPAKVTFACSANPIDFVESINLAPEQQKLLASITDIDFKQTVRDFCVNQQFRKDYWIKGRIPLSPLRQHELMMELRIILTTPRSDVLLKVSGARGEAMLNEQIYSTILDLLADHRIHVVGDLEKTLAAKGVQYPVLLEALVLLAGMGHVSTVQDDGTIESSVNASQKLNQEIILKSRSVADLSHLASPVLGGGIFVPRFQQLFIMAIKHGIEAPEEWSVFVWNILKAQNQAIIKDGKVLATPEENLAELNEQANTFYQKQLPILKGLGIV